MGGGHPAAAEGEPSLQRGVQGGQHPRTVCLVSSVFIVEQVVKQAGCRI